MDTQTLAFVVMGMILSIGVLALVIDKHPDEQK
ncbi:hypothetical protein Hbal_1257 [Hirschia baltica ATCC 49814]|uniref:Uncharacterized protein n=1 Tax=Hirschia baltica (strain ATCC 49814 / DSM 5838 / IFAM 1418) TaxID=582402 RepID=C6XIC3_HIRBI|nr:hypothetical protein Hbal_1257 [Hirschia baltica ATCC 49814]